MSELAKISVRVDSEIYKRLRLLAIKEGKSVQEIINGLLRAYVSQKETVDE